MKEIGAILGEEPRPFKTKSNPQAGDDRGITPFERWGTRCIVDCCECIGPSPSAALRVRMTTIFFG